MKIAAIFACGVATRREEQFLEAVLAYQIDWEGSLGAFGRKLSAFLGVAIMGKEISNNCRVSAPVPALNLRAIACALLLWGQMPISVLFAQSLPPPEDTPDEVLRTEIYTSARSPVDGKLMTAAEYVELHEDLTASVEVPPESQVSPKVAEVIRLLKLRAFLKRILPFF
jgi:hypothetical protein